MNEQLEKLQELSKLFDLSSFYCVTLWPKNDGISLQGLYSEEAFKIAEFLDIDLELNESIASGTNGIYKITLTT